MSISTTTTPTTINTASPDHVIMMTDVDRERLMKTAEGLRSIGGPYRDFAAELEGELGRATIYPRSGIAPTVVTMNSRVRIIDLRTQERSRFTIVYPNDADILEGRMSVISPLGLALLGQKAGDVVELRVPAGVRRFLIEAVVYQPEAAGDEHL